MNFKRRHDTIHAFSGRRGPTAWLCLERLSSSCPGPSRRWRGFRNMQPVHGFISVWASRQSNSPKASEARCACSHQCVGGTAVSIENRTSLGRAQEHTEIQVNSLMKRGVEPSEDTFSASPGSILKISRKHKNWATDEKALLGYYR